MSTCPKEEEDEEDISFNKISAFYRFNYENLDRAIKNSIKNTCVHHTFDHHHEVMIGLSSFNTHIFNVMESRKRVMISDFI